MVLGALDALDEHRIGGKVALAGIDGLPETLKEIKRGRIKATIFQDPELQGAKAIKACVDCLKRKELDKEILIPFTLVTIDNVDEFKEIADRVYPKSQ
jgi:ABC-type sugar transport system substrate-binding protein